jgi:hypothetical protein
LQITTVGNQARSAQHEGARGLFTVSFNYLCNTAAPADGMTFALQNAPAGLAAIAELAEHCVQWRNAQHQQCRVPDELALARRRSV